MTNRRNNAEQDAAAVPLGVKIAFLSSHEIASR